VAELILVEELQTYLVAQGVGVLPADADPALTTIILSPRDGYLRPRKGKEAATVTLVDTQLGSVQELEAWIEESFVDVIVTAPNNGTVKLIHRVIRNLIHPIEGHGGRKQWMAGALLIELSTVWRGEQPLAQDDAVYVRTASYRFQVRRKALAGTPDLP
jgi:hypothetical protein